MCLVSVVGFTEKCVGYKGQLPARYRYFLCLRRPRPRIRGDFKELEAGAVRCKGWGLSSGTRFATLRWVFLSIRLSRGWRGALRGGSKIGG